MAIKRKAYKGMFTDDNEVFVCDTEADISSLPTDCPAGSTAFVISTSQTYMIDSDGTWNEIEVDGGGGDITLTTLNVYTNGTYNAPAGSAYKKIVADVSGAGTASVIYDSVTDKQSAVVPDMDGNVPLRNMTISIDPVQKGTEDPSTTNVRPISGFTGAVIRRTGKNLWGGDALLADLKAAIPSATVDSENRTLTFNASAPVSPPFCGLRYGNRRGFQFAENTRYTFILTMYKSSGIGSNFIIHYTDGTNTKPAVSEAGVKETVVVVSAAGKTVQSITKNTMSGNTTVYADESGIFEGVLTADDFVPYNGTEVTVEFPNEAGTVYGGTLDVTAGTLTVTWAKQQITTVTNANGVKYAFTRLGANGYVVNYKGLCNVLSLRENHSNTLQEGEFDVFNSSGYNMAQVIYYLPGMTGSSASERKSSAEAILADLADSGTTMEVAYMLAEPLVYSLTPSQITALTGYNTFTANCGDIQYMEYQADTHHYIDRYMPGDISPYAEDGKTHIWIRIDDDTPADRRAFPLTWSQSVSNGVTVDWGDGSGAETFSGTGADTHAHTYASGGGYEITLEVTDGTISFDSIDGTSGYAIYGPKANAYSYNRERITCIVFGNGITKMGDYMMQYNNCMKCVTIPSGVTSIGDGAFNNCLSLTSAYLPNSAASVGSYAFYSCFALESLRLSPSTTTIGGYAFYNCYALKSIEIPSGVTVLDQYIFHGCYNLTSVIIPSGVTQIGAGAFDSCYGLTKMTIPASVTSIGASAFSNCYGIKEYHIQRTTPPTLSGSSAFTGIASDCVIYVPYSEDHSVLNAYKSATNWATYASKMQEEAQA